MGNKALNEAGLWFLHSGIQEEQGGVARYYRSDSQKNARTSTEITGYAVSTLVYLHGKTGRAEYLNAAVRAGRFLSRIAWNPSLGMMPFEHSVNGGAPPLFSYFFDCGIIVRGLLALWRAAGDSEYLEAAAEIGRSMEREFAAGRTFHPILSLPERRPLPYASQWSRSPGCYQLKSALAWQDLHETTGERHFGESYQRALGASLEMRDEFLPDPAGPEKTMDRLHAYCYFLEGLTPFAMRADCRLALTEGLERVSRYLRAIAPVFERSDVYAQLLRARIFAEQLAGIAVNAREAEEEAAKISGFQLKDSDPRLEGGYGFGRKGAEALPFANPVSTAFCLQALEMWNEGKTGAQEFDRRALI